MGLPLLQFVTFPQGPTKPSSVIAVSTVFPVLCIAAIVLRFNIRKIQKAPLLLDDWLMIPAILLVIGMDIIAFIGVANHVWGHLIADEPSSGSNTLEGKLIVIFNYVQLVALCTVKLGALSFYGRVFANKSKVVAFDVVRKATVVIVVIWGLAMILLNSFQCGVHIDALWDGFNNFTLYCDAATAFAEGSGISNAILDAWILILPLPKIWTLHTTASRKLAISGVFLVGLLGLAASLARMVAQIQIADETFAANGDYRLMDTLTVFWSNLEIGVSLLAVNLPSLWSYRTKFSPEKFLASIRSKISLSSFLLTSSRKYDSNDMEPLSDETRSLQSIPAKSKFVASKTGNSKVFVAYDVEAQKTTPLISEGGITVKSSILQTKDQNKTLKQDGIEWSKGGFKNRMKNLV